MKNLSKIHLLFAMGIIFASNSMMPAEESSKSTKSAKKTKSTKECHKKETSQPTASHKKSKDMHQKDHSKESMKKIEREINDILKKFKKNKDAQTAQDKLDMITEKITTVVRQMQKENSHMWKVHKHTLERKVKDARMYIQEHSSK